MNTLTVVGNLGQSVALLLAFSFIYNLLTPMLQHMARRWRSVLEGIAFGLFAVLALLIATPFAGGFLLDARSILVAVAGFIGGPIAGLIAASLVNLLRLSMGGAGAAISVPSVYTSAIIGAGFYGYQQRRQTLVGSRGFILLGILLTCSRIAWTLRLGGDQGLGVVQQVFVSVSVLYPLGVWLLATSLRNERRHNETIEALAVERTMLRTLIDIVPDYIFIKDSAGQFILSNTAHAKAARTTVEALLGKRASQFFPTDLAARYNSDDALVMKGQSIVAQERQTVDAQGAPIWVTTTKVPMTNSAGKVIGVVGISRDITKSKQAEEAVRQSELKYRRIIDTSTEGIWMIDAANQTTFVNPCLAEMFGYDIDEMMDICLLDYINFTERPTDVSPSEKRLQKFGQEPDYKFPKKDGSDLWAIVSTAPILDENGQYNGALAMLTDITDRKHAEQQTLELEAERQRVNVLKRFINDISHDFRTPLSILQTSLFILRRTATEQQQQRIDTLEAQVSRLTDLFESMQDVYTLETKTSVRFDLCDVNIVLARLVGNQRPIAEQNLQILEFLPGEDLPKISINKLLVERAITHLLRNALNFTPPTGTITLRTMLQNNQVVVEVRDTGIGIKPESLPHIFEHFYRADQARSSQTGGSGLGLAIVRRIAETHGGAVTVESAVGQGTSFRFLLPVAAPHSVPTL